MHYNEYFSTRHYAGFLQIGSQIQSHIFKYRLIIAIKSNGTRWKSCTHQQWLIYLIVSYYPSWMGTIQVLVDLQDFIPTLRGNK